MHRIVNAYANDSRSENKCEDMNVFENEPCERKSSKGRKRNGRNRRYNRQRRAVNKQQQQENQADGNTQIQAISDLALFELS